MTTLAKATKNVLVYCGAAAGTDVGYTAAAGAFGEAVGSRGCGLVYGGHHAGMMGAVADGCRRTGGPVLGVFPEVLQGKEHPPEGIELRRVPDMHTRKAVMVDHACAIVALPGGFGTLDELFEQLTWRVIGVHDKPIGLFDVVIDGQSYWQPLLDFLDHAVTAGFIRPAARSIALVDDDADRLLTRLGL